MGTGKPLIAILMAVYEPRMDWLREQLVSLEGQTYPNLRLYLRDDCSPTVPFGEIEACVAECIRSFPCEVWRNEENLGSNRTFERLTEEAEGEYFAYCDQDDVWLPEKLAVLQEALEREKALLVCSDMYIIDGVGQVVADSITKVRKHHKFCSGEGLSKELLIRNFVTGCTMLVKARAAKMAVPFCPYMVHDHYLSLWCGEHGKIVSLTDRLIRYRVHKNSQTGVLAGVVDKESYKRVRIDTAYQKFLWLRKNFPCCEETHRTIMKGLRWGEARERNWAHKGGKREIWRHWRLAPLTCLFEIIGSWMPDILFMWVVGLRRKNLL